VQVGLSSELQRQKGDIAELRSALTRLSRPTPGSAVARRIATVESALRRQRREVATLNDAIVESPAKALQMPLLRRDLTNQAAASRDAIAAVQGDIDRQYDLMKWVIGSLFVGILGMMLTVVVPALKARGERPTGTRPGDTASQREAQQQL
jgi:uncharacterized coiled-coil protein SlyX